MDWYIGHEWKSEIKGLRKVVISLKYPSVKKPTELSKIRIQVENVKNLQGRPSNYLNCPDVFELEMGSATTPLDCYTELLIQQMVLGEMSKCYITIKSGESISFDCTLLEIISDTWIFLLSVSKMYHLALKYKDNGVKMFKDYPIFAHDYFSRAAKCLISYKPFKNLTKELDGVNGSDMEILLQNIQTNIAACLLQQQRYEHVLYLTDFVDSIESPSEKSVYRRATAFYNIKEFEKTMQCIEKVHNFKEKKDFLNLYNKAKECKKTDNEKYKSIVQRMFN